MKKILHVIDSLDSARGGPVQSVRNLSEGFSNLGYAAEVVCADSPEKGFLKTLDTRVNVNALGPSFLNYGFCPSIYSWMARHVSQFDLVIIHGTWQFHGLAAWLASRGKVPYCIFTHGMLDPYFKKAYPLKHLKKVIYWLLIQKWILKEAKAVLYTSIAEKKCAQTAFPAYSGNGIVVDYGVKPPPAEISDQQKAWEKKCPDVREKKYFIYLGRVHEKKGIDLTILAFIKCAKTDPELHLVVAGENNHDFGRKMMALALNCEESISSRIHWVGLLLGDEKWGALRSADAFVLHTHHENFGQAIAESLACGTPVLISDKVNIFQEILDAEAGIVGEDTYEGALKIMTQWIQSTAVGKEEFRIRARQLFEKRYNIHKNIQAIADAIF